MTVIVVASLLCIINVVMWVVFAVRFDSYFSTERILNEARSELNSMLRDILNSTDRSVSLIDDRIRQVKAFSAELERKLTLYRSETEKNEQRRHVEQSLAVQLAQSVVETPSASAPPAQVRPAGTRRPRKSTATQTPAERYRAEQLQGSLFVTEKGMQELEAQGQNDALRTIPVVGPQVYLSDTPITPKKSFRTRVRELSVRGESIDAIAKALNSSTQEVKFALEF